MLVFAETNSRLVFKAHSHPSPFFSLSSDHGPVFHASHFFLKGEFFSAFKQASRREDDIAKVTSGMRVLFKPGTIEVQELSLCFGGMADRTISALKTTPKQLSK